MPNILLNRIKSSTNLPLSTAHNPEDNLKLLYNSLTNIPIATYQIPTYFFFIHVLCPYIALNCLNQLTIVLLSVY